MFYFCSSIDWRYIAILLKHQIAETWKRNNTGPVKNVNTRRVVPGVEEDQDHVEAGGQGDSRQLPGLRGPRTMVRTRFLDRKYHSTFQVSVMSGQRRKIW